MSSWLQSKLLVVTSLEGGSGDYTDKLTTIGGVGSARLHLRPLFHAANHLNLNPRVLSLDVDDPSILSKLGNPNLCVVGKINHFDDSRVRGFAMATLASVARLKSKNVKVVLMYCDNLAPLHCSRGSLYRDLLNLSDHIIVPSNAMADLAKQFLPATTKVSIIEDPWQVRMQPYLSLSKASRLRIGWFGNANNIFFLRDKIGSLMRSIDMAHTIELVVLSSKVALKIAESAFQASLPFALRNWKLELVQWDDLRQPEQLEQVLGSVHVVWLPSDPSSPVKAGVSHNRLVDAVRSGSIVVASNMQSYQELHQLVLMGDDHGTLINRLIPQYDRLANKYQSIRSSLLERFSPEINLNNWKSLLTQLANEASDR